MNKAQKQKVVGAFENYYLKVVKPLNEKYGLLEHLAKVDVTVGNRDIIKERVKRQRRALDLFNEERKKFDPEGMFLTEKVSNIVGIELT